MNVVFIHVNYNNTSKTIDCVSSIFENSIEDVVFKIIIIDNNSRNQEKQQLKNWYNNQNKKVVTIHFLDDNIGYFPALNYGLIHYQNIIDVDYVIIGNNDLLFENIFLTKLSKKKYDKSVFVIAPNIVNEDNNHQNPQIVYKYKIHQLIFLDLYFTNYFLAKMLEYLSHIFRFRGSQTSRAGHDKSQFISIGYGACYILTKEYLNRIKTLPDYLFLMNEENALSDVVFKNNGRIYYDSELVVHHMEHSSVGLVIKKHIYKIAQKSYKISKKHFKNKDLYDKYII